MDKFVLPSIPRIHVPTSSTSDHKSRKDQKRNEPPKSEVKKVLETPPPKLCPSCSKVLLEYLIPLQQYINHVVELTIEECGLKHVASQVIAAQSTSGLRLPSSSTQTSVTQATVHSSAEQTSITQATVHSSAEQTSVTQATVHSSAEESREPNRDATSRPTSSSSSKPQGLVSEVVDQKSASQVPTIKNDVRDNRSHHTSAPTHTSSENQESTVRHEESYRNEFQVEGGRPRRDSYPPLRRRDSYPPFRTGQEFKHDQNKNRQNVPEPERGSRSHSEERFNHRVNQEGTSLPHEGGGRNRSFTIPGPNVIQSVFEQQPERFGSVEGISSSGYEDPSCEDHASSRFEPGSNASSEHIFNQSYQEEFTAESVNAYVTIIYNNSSAINAIILANSIIITRDQSNHIPFIALLGGKIDPTLRHAIDMVFDQVINLVSDFRLSIITNLTLGQQPLKFQLWKVLGHLEKCLFIESACIVSLPPDTFVTVS